MTLYLRIVILGKVKVGADSEADGKRRTSVSGWRVKVQGWKGTCGRGKVSCVVVSLLSSGPLQPQSLSPKPRLILISAFISMQVSSLPVLIPSNLSSSLLLELDF